MQAGYLSRQAGIIKLWKRYYYRLDGDELVEYLAENGRELSRLKLTSKTSILTTPHYKEQLIFHISTGSFKNNVYLAENDKAYEQWTSTLKNVCRRKQDGIESVNLEDFDIIKVIGRGTYGKVSLVRHKKSEKLYAMKSMSKRMLHESKNIENVLIEREVLIQNNHPFLVKAHYTFQTETKIFIILDYIPGGEIFSRIKDEGRFSVERAKLYAAEILLGIEHLHKHGLIYRDLKPENLMIDEDGHIKITDFGFTKTNITTSGQTTSTFCGTPEYLAPEVLLQQPYTRSVDWWSFGVILYEMLSGLPPFFDPNPKKMIIGILYDKLLYPRHFDLTTVDLISKLMDRNSKDRLGSGNLDSEEIKSHPFFDDINWDDVLAKRTSPEWIPPIKNAEDTQCFDIEFTEEPTGISFEDPALVPFDVQNAFEDFTCNQEEPSVIDF